MKIAQYQVDAFASRPFEGNPAAVVPLERWPDDALMQAMALENNLSETAFFVPTARGFHLRWFTPAVEVDLCGHATLATAHVLFSELGYRGELVTFETRSGDLIVRREDGAIVMDFPAQPPSPCAAPEALAAGLGRAPVETLRSVDFLAVFEREADVRALRPDMGRLATVEARGVIATAPGDTCDFVSRFFGPQSGVPEDPVTGSAHCELAPYWARRLGKNTFQAQQISPRGGDLGVVLTGARVLISGRAVTVMRGEWGLEHPR